jgi:hypothetical protein
VIADDRSGKEMFCKGDPYDPGASVIAVAATIEDERLPCGSFVRLYRHTEGEDVLTAEAVVADIFADPLGFDENSDLARKFNLSRAVADAVDITGVGILTVELIKERRSD